MHILDPKAAVSLMLALNLFRKNLRTPGYLTVLDGYLMVLGWLRFKQLCVFVNLKLSLRSCFTHTHKCLYFIPYYMIDAD